MKKIDYLATEYAKKFAKNWDYFILCSESYSQGLKDGYVLPFLEEDIEVEFKDGNHQLSTATFLQWKKDKENMDFKEALKTFLPWLDFTDLRVDEKDGKISFMGVCDRNDSKR